MTDIAPASVPLPVSPNVIPENILNTDAAPVEKASIALSTSAPLPPAPSAKPHKARRRPRRRAAGSDESGSERGSVSDSSLSHLSDSEDSEAEADGEQHSPATSHPQDEPVKPAGPSAAEFSAGAHDRDASGPRKGQGGKAVIGKDGKERYFTEEENKRYEERRAKMKERQKAKRAEAKEARKREAEGKAQPAAAANSGPSSAKTIAEPAPVDSSGPAKATGSSPAVSNIANPPIGPRRQSRPSQGPSQPVEASTSTSRAGGFWPHDQQQFSGPQRFAGRGARGGFVPRGMIRGRGRGRGGFGFPGPFQQNAVAGAGQPVGEPNELSAPERKQGGGKLAMDLVEEELQEAREKNRAAKLAASEAKKSEIPVEQRPSTSAAIPESGPSADAAAAIVAPAEGSKRELVDHTNIRWGHEAYEAMAAEPQGPAEGQGFFPRGGPFGVRGRGRGRGAFRGAPVGGGIARQAMAGARFQHQFQQTSVVRPGPEGPSQSVVSLPPTLATKQSAVSSSITAPAFAPNFSSASAPVPAVTSPATTLPDDATRVTDEDLLGPASDGVTVKLPGQRQSTVVPVSKPSPVPAPAALPPTAPSRQPARAGGPHTPDPSTPVFTPGPASATASASGSGSAAHTPFAEIPRVPSYPDMMPAAPMQYPLMTGSDGSMSSSGHFSAQPAVLPPGVGVTPNGELYDLGTGSPVVLDLSNGMATPPLFYASAQLRQTYQPAFYSPDQLYQAQVQGVPLQSPNGMYFSPGPGGVDGRGSPLPATYVTSPYGAQGGAGSGYFAPARQNSKVVIRAPTGSGEHAHAHAGGPDPKAAPFKATGAAARSPNSHARPNGTEVNGVSPEMYAAYYAQQRGHYNPYLVASEGMNGVAGQEVYYDQRVYGAGGGGQRGRGQRGAYGGAYNEGYVGY